MDDVELVTIPKALLLQLLKKEEQLHHITDIFKIPRSRTGEEWVGKGITERISTYLTSYLGRRSIVERETGAAFIKDLNELITDPVVDRENGKV